MLNTDLVDCRVQHFKFNGRRTKLVKMQEGQVIKTVYETKTHIYLLVVRICVDFTPNCSFLVTSTKLSGMIDFNVAVNIRYGAK